MKKTKCDLCGGEVGYVNYDNHIGRYKREIRIRFEKFVGQRLFAGKIAKCQECGYSKKIDVPCDKDLFGYYKNDYWDGKPIVSDDDDDYLKNKRSNAQISLISDEVINGMDNILEIGAGGAYTSQLIRSINGSVSLDVCESAKQWQSYYRERNINKISDYFPFQNKVRYSYIHTSHWLEHVADLSDTLNTLSSMLIDNGHIFVEVPNTEYYYWDLDVTDTPHLHFFTKKSLMLAFDIHGYKTVTIGAFGNSWNDFVYRYRPSGRGMIDFECYDENFDGAWIRAVFQKRND